MEIIDNFSEFTQDKHCLNTFCISNNRSVWKHSANEVKKYKNTK